jgi:hypothetical protein
VVVPSVPEIAFAKNIQRIKNIALRRYRQYQKIIGANSALSFQRKETVLAMLWKILQPMKSTKSNVKT